MRKTIIGLGLGAALAVSSAAGAHHAAQAQFDLTKNITITAPLSKVELINPHSYLHFLVKDKDGKAYDLSLETVTPVGLQRAGLSVRDNLKVGDTFKITYSPTRNGTKTVGFLHAITLTNGTFISVSAPQNINAAREQQAQ